MSGRDLHNGPLLDSVSAHSRSEPVGDVLRGILVLISTVNVSYIVQMNCRQKKKNLIIGKITIFCSC